MYKIIFYEDKLGNSEVYDYIKALHDKKDKDSRINFTKISAYMRVLSKLGNRAGEPYTKHIDGDIWELRPLKNRIFYAYYKNDTFIILHHFIKKSKKTPCNEIDRAKRNLRDYLERE